MADKKVQLELSEDEALVFFEWLARFNKGTDQHFADQAEQRVLWDLEATLESELAQPFASNYGELLGAARSRVRDPQE